MTAPSTPREQQRVSDSNVDRLIAAAEAWVKLPFDSNEFRTVDQRLRSFGGYVICELAARESNARATITQRDAEIAQLRQAAKDAQELTLAAHQQVAQLREALATARRDGWIAGREAAASLLERVAEEDPRSEGGPYLDVAAQGVRALAPPAAADGGRDG